MLWHKIQGAGGLIGGGGGSGAPPAAYVVSNNADSITSIDISNPSNLVQLDSLTSAQLDGAFGVALA